MTSLHLLLALSPPPAGEQNPLMSLVPMLLVFAVFYFVLVMPMRQKQKKIEETVKALKPGDKVVVTPGILATVERVDQDAILVRIDDKAKMRVLRSAIAGMQGQPLDMEKK